MDIQVETINHLGLIAGIIDEIGIVDIINNEIGIDPREVVTAGQVVKAIILNGLGFVSRPLYLFLLIALAAREKSGIAPDFSHLDASSFSLHGKYERESEPESILTLINPEEGQKLRELPIKITHGYSRDHRPDLKQFIIDLIVSGDGDVPLFIRIADGNAHEVRRSLNDKAAFGQIVKDYNPHFSQTD